MPTRMRPTANKSTSSCRFLKRSGIVEIWHDRRLVAGEDWDHGIREELERANIILLLISPDFMASEYINDVEIKRAMERHDVGSACVIPVILRPCIWDLAPFAKLQALPKKGKAVSKWANPDDAYLDIAEGIRRASEIVHDPRNHQAVFAPTQSSTAAKSTSGPRSGNLQITKNFTDVDKDIFKNDAFDYIRRYIKGSLEELAARHRNVRSSFRQIDGSSFSAVVYRDGLKVSACTVMIGGRLGDIMYSSTENAPDNSCNESLSVVADDQELFFKAAGMSMITGNMHRDQKLSVEEGAELFWSLLIKPLQHS